MHNLRDQNGRSYVEGSFPVEDMRCVSHFTYCDWKLSCTTPSPPPRQSTHFISRTATDQPSRRDCTILVTLLELEVPPAFRLMYFPRGSVQVDHVLMPRLLKPLSSFCFVSGAPLFFVAQARRSPVCLATLIRASPRSALCLFFNRGSGASR